jgi:hypothetical protein
MRPSARAPGQLREIGGQGQGHAQFYDPSPKSQQSQNFERGLAMRDLFTEVMAAVTTGAGAGPTRGNAGRRGAGGKSMTPLPNCAQF